MRSLQPINRITNEALTMQFNIIAMHQASAYSTAIDRLHQRGFNALYDRSLLYNTCWEDPALDREAMQLNDQDRLVMITSAGCNALDYALDEPAQITCIDANSRRMLSLI